MSYSAQNPNIVSNGLTEFDGFDLGNGNAINLWSMKGIDNKKDMIDDLKWLSTLAREPDIISKSNSNIVFENINQVWDYYYNKVPQDIARKADSPFLTSTTGYINHTFGDIVVPHYSLESNILAVLKKYPYEKEGYRAQQARIFTAGSGGVAEHAAIPETDNAALTTFKIPLKTIAHAVNWSTLMDVKSRWNDSVRVPDYVKSLVVKEHHKCISEMMFIDPDTLAGNNVESIRRMLCSNAELTAKSYTAGDADPWTEALSTIDRDAGSSTFDANSLYHATTQDFVPSLVDNGIRLIKAVHPNGFIPSNYAIVTSHVQLDLLAQSFENNRFFRNDDQIVAGVNGIQRSGFEVGFEVASYRNIPFIGINDAPAGEAYLIDLNAAFISMGMPTMVLDYGFQRGDPSGVDKLGSESLITTIAELGFFTFNTSTKFMNLSTS